MTARQPISPPVARSHATAWADAIAQIERAGVPKINLPVREEATPDDVRAAARLLATHRSRAPRKLSALDQVIVGYLIELPDICPAVIWADLKRIAEDGGNAVIVEFDRDACVISWSHSEGSTMSDISFQAFRRRVQRLRRR
jgi:hypothetical protein